MKKVYSHSWLQSFFDTQLPHPDEIQNGLMRHSFEVESVIQHNNDTIYELDITPNRATDCLAHYGIAKEVSAIFSLPMNRHYFPEPYTFARNTDCIKTTHCDRYTVIKVENITLQETPADMLAQMEAVGHLSIHPIVDFTNHLFLDIGQPIHAFDASKISGTLGVRQARAGETLLLLNEETVTLTADDMVIIDDDRPVALAGIMGGDDTKVDENTKSIYLETASFHSHSVRHTMRRLNITSDAGLRFSQDLEPRFVGYTAHRVAELFGAHGTITDSYDSTLEKPATSRKTGVSPAEVNRTLGTAYTPDDISAALDRLHIPHTYENSRTHFLNTLKAQIGKPYRLGASVSRDAPDIFDCSSLVSWCAAQAGKSIPRISVNQYLSATPVDEPEPGDLIFMHSDDPAYPKKTESIFEKRCPVSPGTVPEGINHLAVLLDDGTTIETEGNTGVNAVVVKKFDKNRIIRVGRIWDGDEHRFIINQPPERPDLRNEIDIIEEIGRILGYDTIPTNPPQPPAAPPPTPNQPFAKHLAIISQLRTLGFSETITYSFHKKGDVCVSHPVAKDKGCLRTNLRKGMEEALTTNAYNGELLGLPDIRLVEIGSVFTESGEETRVAIGITETLGRPKADIHTIEKRIKEILPIPGSFDGTVWEVPLADIPLTPAAYDLPPALGDIRCASISPYPFVLRDIAVFVPNNTQPKDTEQLIQNNSGEHLRRINMFDTFEKDGRTSYAFRLVFQSDQRTLDDTTVNEQMETLYRTMKENGYEVR